MMIRDATADDAPAICAIWNPVISQTVATFNTELKTPQMIAADIERRVADGHGFFVIEDGGTCSGFATYFQFRGGPGYRHSFEHTIVLGDLARGKGCGRLLMTHLETHAAQNGCHVLMAGVSGENQAGIDFHRAVGFEDTAILPQVGYKFGRWMDLHLLHKVLSH